MWSYNHSPIDNDWLAHVGVKGMKWGYSDGKANGGRKAGEDEKKSGTSGSEETSKKEEEKKEEPKTPRTLSGAVKRSESGEDSGSSTESKYTKVKLKSGKYVYKLNKNADSKDTKSSESTKKTEESSDSTKKTKSASKKSSDKKSSSSSSSKKSKGEDYVKQSSSSSKKASSTSKKQRTKGEEYVKRIIEMLLEDED